MVKHKKTTKAHPPKMKLLLPKVDVAFKLLFGDVRNIDILIDFLKSVLTLPETEYESMVIVDPHLKREKLKDKLGIVDVKVTTKSGNVAQIEAQVLEQEAMSSRLTYYNSKMLVTQLSSGDDYENLQKTISILIADFELIENSEKYHHVFQLRDKDTGIMFTDLVEINTLEVGKISNQPDNTAKYQWLRFLKSETEEEFQMVAQSNPVIKKAYVELKRLSQDEEAQLLYEAREKAIRDENSRIKSTLKKGRKEWALETAQNLLKINLSTVQISEATGLSTEEIEKLKNNN
jgi:predicted transposase/invertase (TIGR01784 family)